VSVRVANAAPGFFELGFQREQDSRNLASLPFKSASEFSYDADTYDFFIFERGYDNSPGRTWTVAPTFEEDKSYTVVLAEVATEVHALLLERPAAPPADAAIEAVHAAASLPSMDLYLERPGLGIGGATPRGSLVPGGQLAALPLASGDYELWLTAAGNPADVLLATGTVNLPAGNTTSIVIMPEGNRGTAQMSVLFISAAQETRFDRNVTAEIRVLNGATDRAPRDFAINGVFSPPLFSATPFGEPTAYAPVPVAASMPINVTPAGNAGVLELNQTFQAFAGERATIIFGGPTGALTHAVLSDDGRRFHNEAKLRFFNAASQFSGVELVIGNPGDDPATLAAAAALGLVNGVDYLALGRGEYDLYLRQFLGSTVIAGPLRVSIAAGGIYGVLAIDGPDTATARLLLLDDFP
jgi:hypothetical protein